MLHLRGCPALSEFRLLKLRDQISALVPALSEVRADFLHVAELNESLADAERAVLDKLLSYGPAQADVAGGGVMLIVVPRPGTMSPSSSTATDIVHNCGLDSVRRVERGIVYTRTLDGADT